MFPSINRAQINYSINSVELTSNKQVNSVLMKNISRVSNTHDQISSALNTKPQNKKHGETYIKVDIAACIKESIPEIPEPDYSECDIDDSTTTNLSSNKKNTNIFSGLTEVYRELSGVSDVKLLMDFNQEDFIQNSTLAKEGVCVPLTSKWLTERNSIIDFFSDISTPEGREEIMHVAMERVKTGNPGVILDYVKNKGYTIEIYDNAAPVDVGLYSISLELPGSYHNMALELTKNNEATFFDPNYGEFFFTSLTSFNDFLPPYLRSAYDIKDEPNISYVQYVKMEG